MTEQPAVRKHLLENRDDHFAAVRKIKSANWSVRLKAIEAYRGVLLAAQEYRCAYCRMSIALDEVGYREIDHVLPKVKSPEKDFDDRSAVLNDFKSRQDHTHGYARFTYEPLNLALACKHCNAAKSAFDGLKDRSMSPLHYPDQEDSFAWVHPHFDAYEKHIECKQGMLYTALSADQGGNVISACGLDKTEGLNARILDAMVFNTREFTDALLVVKLSREDIDIRGAAKQIHDTFKVATVRQIELWLRQLREGRCGRDTIKVIDAVLTTIGMDGEIYAQP